MTAKMCLKAILNAHVDKKYECLNIKQKSALNRGSEPHARTIMLITTCCKQLQKTHKKQSNAVDLLSLSTSSSSAQFSHMVHKGGKCIQIIGEIKCCLFFSLSFLRGCLRPDEMLDGGSLL